MDQDLAPADETIIHEDYEALLTQAEGVLDGIDRALARLDDGTYGRCEVCGEAIDDGLLAASPVATQCERHLGVSGQF